MGHHAFDSEAPYALAQREHERTAPMASPEPCGPSHEDFRALAEGRRSAPLLLGGRYQVLARIGRGGMSTVYRGRTITRGRPVAIKILDDDRSDSLARFVAEARITGRVWGPHVVEVLDFGSTAEGVVYLVMELLDGEDLRETIRREGPMPWPRVQELMLEICAGLSAIHAGAVTHRDLKPANCFCVRSEAGTRVKLLDFGIATCPTLSSRDGQRMTETGRVIGTPEYMSPEHARGDTTDERSDVYAAGIILGELLTGQVPFEARSSTSVLAMQIYEPTPRLSELAGPTQAIEPALDRLYAKALAKNPIARFQSAADLAEAITAIKPHELSTWKPLAAAAEFAFAAKRFVRGMA